MRDTRGYAARRLGENLWVPAGLARGRAAVIVAVISTLALVAVLYVDTPLSGAVTPVASASESTASHRGAPNPTASGLCLTAAATVPTGAGASSGCTGASAAGADLPHRAGSAESPAGADQGSRHNSPNLIGQGLMTGARQGNWLVPTVKKPQPLADRRHAGLYAGPG